MTKREEAEQAIRMRVREDSTALVEMLREVINEALEEAAMVATKDRQHVPVAFDIAHDIRALKVAP